MIDRSGWSLIGAALLAVGIGAGATSSLVTSSPASAQQNQNKTFPDVKADYWAEPFIQTLGQQGIITGYLDGTFKPNRPMDRDEFAAIVRQAFSQDRVRNIPSGSSFADVPANYWAAPPIEEAYETGFMKGYPENLFRPQEELSRAEALMALAKGLNLSYDPARATTTQATTTSVPVNRTNQRRATKNRLVFPIAATALMQPLFQKAAVAQSPATRTAQLTAGQTQNASSAVSAKEYVKSYYQDADRIPEYAVDEVAAATQANIVVNYPQPRILNPNQTLNRGAAAALIHQAMVSRGKLKPLPDNVEASNYIVNPTSADRQTAQAR